MKQVIIIGAGFGGLNAAKELAQYKDFSVLLVDKSNHHLFQPLLYQVATAALSPGDIAMPIREIFRDKPQVRTIMANVLAIDKEQKTILLEDGHVEHYDYLIVASGARHSYFGKPHWEQNAPGLKTMHDALSIRERILSSFETAELSDNPELNKRLLAFVVIGGGPTGVEMAGAIAEIAHQSLKKNFRAIDPSHTKIYLIEGGKQLLNSYPEQLATRAQKDLERRGVTVLLNTSVTDITAEGVYLNGTLLQARNIIWAAGNEASPLLKTLNVTTDKSGRVLVEKDCSVPGYPELFVIGDAACVTNKNGTPLPGIAPVAVQEGRYVGKLIGKQLAAPHKPFKYFDRGMMAAIGKYDALVLSGPFKSTGFLAWLAWCFVHIYFLIGYRTKLFVFLQWAFYFFRGQRNIRLIIKPNDK